MVPSKIKRRKHEIPQIPQAAIRKQETEAQRGGPTEAQRVEVLRSHLYFLSGILISWCWNSWLVEEMVWIRENLNWKISFEENAVGLFSSTH